MIGYDYEVVSCVKLSDLQWLSDLSVDLHSAGPSCSELLAMYRWTCGQVIYAEVFVEASEPSRGPVIQTLMHIYGIFIEYSYNSTSTPMFGIKIEVGKCIQLILYWEVLGMLKKCKKWRHPRTQQTSTNINKHQQTITATTNQDRCCDCHPWRWSQVAWTLPGASSFVAHFQSKESPGEFQVLYGTGHHTADASSVAVLPVSIHVAVPAAGPLRRGPGGIWAQRGPFSQRNAIGQGRHLVIHMSRFCWLSLILTESLSVEYQWCSVIWLYTV